VIGQNTIFLISVHLTGIVTMLRKHTVCKEGEALTPEQADILVSMFAKWFCDVKLMVVNTELHSFFFFNL